MEVWREIKDCQGYYASNLGRFKSPRKILKLSPDSRGYARVGMKGKTWRCHRIIAQLFISNPENKPEVNHKNGDKMDCSLDNLEWTTTQENREHYWRELSAIPQQKHKQAMVEQGIKNKESGIFYGDNNPNALGKHKISFQEGRVIVVENLTRWCKDNGYDVSHIHRLKYGGFFQKSIGRWKTVNRCKDIIKVELVTDEE
jgi:hypothetical protein